MPSIHVVYDPDNRLTGIPPEAAKHMRISQVQLSLNEGEINSDKIAEIAGTLSVLLLAVMAGEEESGVMTASEALRTDDEAAP